MRKRNIVLIQGQTWNAFLNANGTRLVYEYPEAGLFARRESLQLADRVARQYVGVPSVSVYVVYNYGLKNETRTEVCK
jgi:hypothetical protein